MTVVDVDRLVDDLADVVHGTIRAVVCTRDGTPLATSAGLSPRAAAHLASVCAGITALTTGAADIFEAQARHTTVRMTRGVLVLTNLPDGSLLAVLTVYE